MKAPLVLVIDCGSTTITITAVDERGHLVHGVSLPNEPHPQPGGDDGWVIWDLDEIWGKIGSLCQEVSEAVGREAISAVTATTFGADGAPMRPDGSLFYPVISWQCSRTQRLVDRMAELASPWEIYQSTGYQVILFNTLLRLMWLREIAPQTLESPNKWLMMPGLLSYRLSGELSLDATSASTMMALDLSKRTWSSTLLSLAGVDESLFPRWVEPGEVIGHVTRRAAEETGLPVGIPVVATGHDTQFAPIGSGARPGEAILSSGTWEILMARVGRYEPNRTGFEEGLLIELDAHPGLWDPQILMMGSGVLEWVRRYFFADLAGRHDAYSAMIGAARQVSPGSGGLVCLPSFVEGTGPAKKHGSLGTLLGLTLGAEPADVYRAALEGLSYQMRDALRIVEESTGFTAKGLRVVGGGSKNDLWNQIRADVTQLPVTTVSQKEATTLGAAMFAFIGAGAFRHLGEAQSAFELGEAIFEPGPDSTAYQELYAAYREVPPALRPVYDNHRQLRRLSTP